MNESRHPLDDLFKNGLDNYSMEPPMHVWEKIDHTRTPLHKLINGFRQNSKWYLSVFVGLSVMSSAAFMLLSAEEPAKQLASTGTTVAPSAQEQTINNTGPGQNGNKVPAPANGNENTSSTNTESTLANTTNTSNETGKSINTKVHLSKQAFSKQEAPVFSDHISPTGNTEETGSFSFTPNAAVPSNSLGKMNPGRFETGNVSNENTLSSINPEKTNGKTFNSNRYNSKWSAELLVSYDFVNRNVQSNDPDYTALVNKSEQLCNAFSLQGRLAYRYNDLFSLKTGLNYSRINGNLNYQQPYTYWQVEDRTVNGTIIDPVKGPQNITYIVHDTVAYTGYKPVNSRNSYTFIDIPVTLNYHFYNGDRWNLTAGAGALFNVGFAQKGMFIDTKNHEAAVLNGTNSPYVARAQINFVFNLGLSYRINNNIDLILEPSLRTGKASLFKESFGASQSFTTYNIFTGVRYRF